MRLRAVTTPRFFMPAKIEQLKEESHDIKGRLFQPDP